MKFMKRAVSAILSAAVIGTLSVPVYALPDAFWAVNPSYTAALEAKDNYGIIEYGQQILDIMESQPASSQKDEIMASRCLEIASAYERLGEYVEAVKYHEIYLPYAERADWADGVKIARDKISAYTPVIDLYTTSSQPQLYYGAKNEPQKGVLFGEVAERTENEDSMILLYLELGADPNYLDTVFKQAQDSGKAVELALNFPNEADQVRAIRDYESYLIDVCNKMKSYPDTMFYLRVAAEMNIWNNAATPAEFQDMFRYVYTLVHQNTDNAAVVWSVSHASSWNMNMEDFYPGDEYVDWVGISAYMIPHFQGVKWDIDHEFNDISFTAGRAADPVKVVKETVDKFGDRKPIMIAEGGCGHYVTSATVNEDKTEWANTHLRMMYWYLPMVYPQIKLMAYFNKMMPEETNNYALYDSPTLNDTYHQLIHLPHFIQNGDAEADVSYMKYNDVINVNTTFTTPIYTYAHLFGDDEPRIEYYVDDKWYSGGDTLPYKIDFDASGLSAGEHTLRVVMASEGRVWYEKTYTLNVTDKPISILINGETIDTEVPPVLENDRTLVPVRFITEHLGANVEWNGDVRMVTITKDDKVITLIIDDDSMYINNEAYELDVPAKIIDDRTYVPLRAIATMLDADVSWDGANLAAIVNTK